MKTIRKDPKLLSFLILGPYFYDDEEILKNVGGHIEDYEQFRTKFKKMYIIEDRMAIKSLHV